MIKPQGKMRHTKMYAIGTRPYADATIAIREYKDEAEDHAENLNMNKKGEPYKVFPVLVHFLPNEKTEKVKH